MKTYDVVFRVRVRAENEEDAKLRALEVLANPALFENIDVKVWVVKRLYCNVKKGPCEPGSFDFCYLASSPDGCEYGVEEVLEDEKESSSA